MFIFFLSPLKAEISDSGEYLKKNVNVRRLSNGITVILLDRGYAPTLAFNMSFRVGSCDESYRTSGTAHMLEHMLFKGTDKLGTKNYKEEVKILNKIEAVGETIDRLKLTSPGNLKISQLEKELKNLQKKLRDYVVSSPYDRIYTENGAVGFNASTSRDKTGYYIQLPSDKLELWAKIESERLRNPVLREYYLERNNVIQERLMRYDSNGEGLLFEKFLAAAFIAHPYRHPTIGWKSNIPYLSIKDVGRFYRTHYIPSNTTITIVGKQNVEETFRVIESYFGKIEASPQPPAITIAEPLQKGERRVELSFESNPMIMIGWHKPTAPSKDDYVCDVISQVLAGGKSSRLYKTLVLEKKLVTDISAWNGSPGARYDNLFMVYAKPAKSADMKNIEKEIYTEINHLKDDISDDEIEKAVNTVESDLIFGLASNNGLAHALSYYQTVFNDWKYMVSYLDNIRKVSKSDIKNVIAKYLVHNNRTVAVLKDSRKGEAVK